MLFNCNAVSASRFQNAARDFKKHTALLQEMRKDVDNIFRRIRSIKAKISQQYPQAYAGMYEAYIIGLICVIWVKEWEGIKRLIMK